MCWIIFLLWQSTKCYWQNRKLLETLLDFMSVTFHCQRFLLPGFELDRNAPERRSGSRSGSFFRLDALALSVIATATWLAGWLGGCLSQPVLYQND